MPGKRYVLIAVLCVYAARAWAKRLTHNSLEIIHLVKKFRTEDVSCIRITANY